MGTTVFSGVKVQKPKLHNRESNRQENGKLHGNSGHVGVVCLEGWQA